MVLTREDVAGRSTVAGRFIMPPDQCGNLCCRVDRARNISAQCGLRAPVPAPGSPTGPVVVPSFTFQLEQKTNYTVTVTLIGILLSLINI